MTRAKEKLILTGIKTKEIDWNRKKEISYIDLLESNSYYDWISKALVHVPTEDFQLQIYHLEDFAWQQEKEEIERQLDKQIFLARIAGEEESRQEEIRRLRETFAYQYVNQAETRGQLKYSVSEIKRMSQTADEEEETMFPAREPEKRIPKFISQEKKISAVSRGTAVHKVFELLDLGRTYSYGELDEQIRLWISQGAIGEEYDKVIWRKDILAFLESDLGKRVRKAASQKKVWKEKQFVMGVPFSEMSEDEESSSYVVVQGIIDLYFEEEDGLVLVDYKTDRIKDQDSSILVRRYKVQLDYYRRALEQMTGKKVKECYIYSVFLKEALVL